MPLGNRVAPVRHDPQHHDQRNDGSEHQSQAGARRFCGIPAWHAGKLARRFEPVNGGFDSHGSALLRAPGVGYFARPKTTLAKILRWHIARVFVGLRT
jgi:hypothetical protein